MKKIGKFCYILAIVLLSNSASGELLEKAYLDNNKNVHVHTRKGEHRQITYKKNSRKLKLAPDNETVTWLKLNDWVPEGDKNPGSDELVIYRNRRFASLKCTPFIRDYWFSDNGSRIAIDCGGRHFAGREILYDVRTLRELASFDQAKVPLKNRPHWSNPDN